MFKRALQSGAVLAMAGVLTLITPATAADEEEKGKPAPEKAEDRPKGEEKPKKSEEDRPRKEENRRGRSDEAKKNPPKDKPAPRPEPVPGQDASQNQPKGEKPSGKPELGGTPSQMPKGQPGESEPRRQNPKEEEPEGKPEGKPEGAPSPRPDGEQPSERRGPQRPQEDQTDSNPPMKTSEEQDSPRRSPSARRTPPNLERPAQDDEGEREVVEATAEMEREMSQRKTEVDKPEEARRVIEEMIGGQSRISQAEQRRENRDGRGPERRPDARARQEDVAQVLRQLRGEEPAARFRDEPGGDDRDRDRDRGRPDDRDRDDHSHRDGYHRPPHFHDGRRFVHYRSRQDIPAILIASSVLQQLAVQNVREQEYYRHFDDDFYDRPGSYRPVSPPPMDYRDDDSYVVSYAVDENSMVSRDDVLFRQGSTQFADDYSYEVVAAIAEAMRDSSLQDSRFVIEGHASAEGDYESNMRLSQQRAERIVREIVRAGVSPERLIPVGYGESEARFPAEAPEVDRQQDRRVVAFRLKE